MAINSNFSIYEPEAWVATALANEYPNRPMVASAVANVEGADVEGLVSARNKSVNISRPEKPTDSVKTYDGSDYVLDTPDANNTTLTINKHIYKGFSIDKADQRFALPSLTNKHFLPRLHQLIDQVNADVKAEARKFEAVFADINTNPTVLDDADLRNARQIMQERKFAEDRQIAVIDPTGENNLTGLQIFQEADKRGNNGVQLSGSMGQAFGFEFAVDPKGDYVQAGSEPDVGDATVASAGAVGDTTISIDNGAGESSTNGLVEGNEIYFDTGNGFDEWYVVDSATGDEIVLKEPLRYAISDGDAVATYTASGRVGNQFFYDPSALSLVTAVMPSVSEGGGNGVRRSAGFEPMNGVNYTVTVEETKKGVDVLIEFLYGIKLFRPDLGVRYLRGNALKS